MKQFLVLLTILLVCFYIVLPLYRYEYHIVANGFGVIKIDKLTGEIKLQSTIKKEYYQKYKKGF